jgi:hypothetical protein
VIDGPPSNLRPDLRAGVALVIILALVGVVAGVLWQWWSPPGPHAFVIGPGLLQPDETEAFVAGDGRFAVISLVVGLTAALLVWFRKTSRGTVTVLALAVGGMAGSLVTAVVGHWTGGGNDSGRTNTVLAALPLSLHMHGLVFLEGGVAVLVYCLFACFVADDDLGRPDPARRLARRSVGPDMQLQHPGRDGDGPGGPQIGDLAL